MLSPPPRLVSPLPCRAGLRRRTEAPFGQSTATGGGMDTAARPPSASLVGRDGDIERRDLTAGVGRDDLLHAITTRLQSRDKRRVVCHGGLHFGIAGEVDAPVELRDCGLIRLPNGGRMLFGEELDERDQAFGAARVGFADRGTGADRARCYRVDAEPTRVKSRT